MKDSPALQYRRVAWMYASPISLLLIPYCEVVDARGGYYPGGLDGDGSDGA